jgi:pSer/pThr/pTyr-binding forkhead associated (FHA) protein
VRAPLPKQVSQNLPIFKVAADQGTHPPVGLDRPVCVVGRQGRANLPLQSPQVSKLHALIVREQRRVYVRDLASTNGVEVNGSPVREVGLSDTDILRIGSYTLKCLSGFGQKGERPAKSGNGAPATTSDAPSAVAAPAELRSVAGSFPFTTGRRTLLIGQRAGCDVRIEHPSLAPVHAIIFEMDGQHHVHSFAPEGTTRLNGRPIHREPLHPGDELLVGEISLRYALVDVSAETAGESLIQPAMDSAVAPSIDPSFHGELEPDAEQAVEFVEVEESPIDPAMDSSISPAESRIGISMESAIAPAITPIASAAAAASAAAGSAATGSKPKRPAEPPATDKPAVKSLSEPVIEPVLERAAESSEDAMRSSDELEPIDLDAAPISAGELSAPTTASTAATSKGSAANDLPELTEPVGSSSDLEPIKLEGEPEALFDDELDESFRANWDAAAGASGKKSDEKNLSATFDEDDELVPIGGTAPGGGSVADGGGPDPRLSATFDEDDSLVPLTDLSGDAGLLGDDADDAPAAKAQPPAIAQPPAVAPVDAVVVAEAQHAAVAAADAAVAAIAAATAAAAAADAAAIAAGTEPPMDEAAGVAASVSQAARLTELAKAAGLDDGEAKTNGEKPNAEDITTMVDEVAEKAQVLKEAWAEFQSDTDPDAPPPT